MQIDDSEYAPGQNYVCDTCGRVHHGPAAGMVLPDPGAVSHIDEQGNTYPATPERPNGNVSHGKCADCAQAFLDEYHRARELRFRRGKGDP